MDFRLQRAIAAGGGVVRVGDVMPRSLLSNATRDGHLIRFLPRVYVDAARLDRLGPAGRLHLRMRAALRYAGDGAAVSHLSALALWQLRAAAAEERIHVTVATSARVRATGQVVVHHRSGVAPVRRDGLAVTTAAQALVDSWPLLNGQDRIGLVIEAFDAKLLDASGMRQAIAEMPKLKGIAALRRLIGLIEAGCRSPLEVWGALHVFDGAGFACLRRQVPMRIGRQVFYLDLYAAAERVNIELDGAAWHGDSKQRERDIKRDALLATSGIMVVRFSYARLAGEPGAVRREALAILRARRR